MATAKFDSTGQLFACFVPSIESDSIKVWDTSSAKLLCEYTSRIKISCFQWGFCKIDEEATSKTKKKKTAKNTSNTVTGAPVKILAIGKDDGSIVLYSPLQSMEVKVLVKHTARVNDLSFSDHSSLLFSCAEDGKLIEWHLDSAVSSSWDGGVSSKKLAVVGESGLLAAASTTLDFWKIAEKKSIKKIKGHSNTIHSLKYLDGFVLSFAEDDKCISVWSPISYKLVATLPLESACSDIVSYGKLVCCIYKEGSAAFWDLNNLMETKKPQCLNSCTFLKYSSSDSGQIIPLVGACFQEARFYAARGTFLNPIFEKLDLNLNDKQIELKRETGQPLQSTAAVKRPKKTEDANPIQVLDSHDFSIPTPCSVDPEHLQKLLNEGDSYSEKMKQLYISEKQINNEPPAAASAKADSMQRMLVQALHSNDRQLLEVCFSISNTRIIENSISKLPSKFVFPLLEEILDRFYKNPNRAGALAIWIKQLFIYHTAYLVSVYSFNSKVPNLHSKLTGLYQALDNRLMVFRKLLKLSGKLDLVVSQISVRNQASVEDLGDQEPMFVYNEDEQENEEESSGNDMEDEAEINSEYSEIEESENGSEEESEMDVD